MVKDLGEEILLRIFSKLDNYELKQCKKVCRAWYPPAHISLIKKVVLCDANIQRFIASMDRNSKPKYLNAVKAIAVVERNPPTRKNQKPPPQVKVDIKKLFFRFPNLEIIKVKGHLYFFDQFKNEAACNILSRCCPKLRMFEVAYVEKTDKTQYCQTLYKLRSIITSIALEFVGPVSKYATTPLIFPRVNNLIRVGKLSDAISVLSQFPALQAIYSEGRHDYLLEDVLESKSKEERDQITKTLSQVTELVFHTNRGLDSFTKGFIKKHFTGLKTFELQCPYLEDKYGEHQHVAYFNDAMLDLLGSAKQTGRIIIEDFAIDDDYLELMLDQVFKKDTVNRVLRLEMVDDDVDVHRKGCAYDPLTVFGTVDVQLKRKERKVTLSFTDREDASRLFERISLNYIDEVEFYSPGSSYYPNYRQEVIENCNRILRKLSPVEEATLEYGDTIIQLDGIPSFRSNNQTSGHPIFANLFAEVMNHLS